MTALNRVIIAGNLTRDPEVRYTPSGTAVGDVGVAISESYRNKAGELVETTCFVDVEVWGRQAETTAEYLSKGSPVLIEGRLRLDQWENQQGEKRSRLKVRADRVQFLSGGNRKGGSQEKDHTENTGGHQNPPNHVPDDVDGVEDEDDLPF